MKKDRSIILIVALVLSGSAMFILAWWLTQSPSIELTKSVPTADDMKGASGKTQEPDVKIGEFFKKFPEQPVKDSLPWPRFRGTDFDNISKQQVKLADSWPKDGPQKLWEVALGEGHAAPAVYGGRLYLLDYNEAEKADNLRCISLETGKDIWNRWYKVHVKRNHGMSRTIPAVTDRYVVSMGPRCHVMCVDTISGDFKWGIKLVEDYGTTTPLWYTGQCPLIDGKTAIIAAGGKDVLLMGVDCETGSISWVVPNTNSWQMSHSSVMPMTIHGKKMYVYTAVGGLIGVSAEEGEQGKILWQTNAFNKSVIAPSPIHLGDGKLLITAGYGAGSMTFKIDKVGEDFKVNVVREVNVKDGLASEQQTPIFWQNRLFAVIPKDGGRLREQFVCVDPANIMKILWSSGKTKRFGLGPYIWADNKFYILDDNGTLTMAKASVDGFEQLAQAKVLDGHDAWGPIAISGTRMLLRDSKKMVCIDIGDSDK